jgi:hypothetical protein
MNPLVVLFFTAMMIDDYIFKEGKFIKYMLYSIIIYWIFCYFSTKSIYHSASRKLLLASYSQSYDPSVYSKVNFDLAYSKKFLSEYENRTGKKISLTLFFTKVLADAIKKYPEFNRCLKFGSLHEKKTVDLAVLVNVADGKVISVVIY